MKIGIMTFWWSEDNYGQLLQCYALQKYLQNEGHDVYLIRYDPRGDYTKSSIWKKILKVSNPVTLYKYLLYKRRKVINMREKREHPRNFEGFRNEYIKQSEKIYYSYRELVENSPPADIYIVGSDQIWNTFGVPVNRAINILNAYLLNFGDSWIKRVSYAASFGKKKLDNDFVDVFSSLLKKFDYVSVREKSGLEICKQCGIDNAEWVPDPTMLLDVDVYRAFYKCEKNIEKSNKPYCFLYLVENKLNFPVQSIYSWAKDKGIEVMYITGNSLNDKYEKIYATIPEWIYLLEHAEYVITNSYHCTIFSLLFKKKFGVIPLAGKNIGMNNRLDTIFELFRIEARLIDIDLSILDKDINWQLVSDTFHNIRDICQLNRSICGKMVCP